MGNQKWRIIKRRASSKRGCSLLVTFLISLKRGFMTESLWTHFRLEYGAEASKLVSIFSIKPTTVHNNDVLGWYWLFTCPLLLPASTRSRVPQSLPKRNDIWVFSVHTTVVTTPKFPPTDLKLHYTNLTPSTFKIISWRTCEFTYNLRILKLRAPFVYLISYISMKKHVKTAVATSMIL